MTDRTNPSRVERDARLRWVPIVQMKVSPVAQRELNQARVDHLAAAFDPEQVGTPTVNERDGHFFIIDGQHRIEAMKQMGWADQQVQCWTYVGLSEQEEADKFLVLNDYLAVNAFSKFKVSVTANRETESDVDRIVRSQGLMIGKSKAPGQIGCVGTLTKIHRRSSPANLTRALRITLGAYGDAGTEASVLDGLSLLTHRFNGALDDEAAIARLGAAHGGVNGLLGRARKQYENNLGPLNQCVAAAAVEIINSGRGGKKLPSWWKD